MTATAERMAANVGNIAGVAFDPLHDRVPPMHERLGGLGSCLSTNLPDGISLFTLSGGRFVGVQIVGSTPSMAGTVVPRGTLILVEYRAKHLQFAARQLANSLKDNGHKAVPVFNEESADNFLTSATL